MHSPVVHGQVVLGRTSDPETAHVAVERLVSDLSRDPTWLGTTAGVTDDGRFVAALLSESPVALPEEWSALTDLTVRSGRRTSLFLPGDIRRARFVQVVQGRVTDLDEVRAHLRGLEGAFRRHLPCLLGTVTIEYDGGRFTRVLHFSTEQEARSSQRARHPELQRRDDAALRLVVGPLEYFDLRTPWIRGPSVPTAIMEA